MKSSIAAGGAGIPGAFLPGLDVAAVSGTWITMVCSIAKEHGRKVEKHTVTKFIAAVGAGAAAYIGGSKAISWLLHFIPGVGTLAVIGLNSAFNFVYTYRFGKLMDKEFAKSEFNIDSIEQFAKKILPIVFAVPTRSEIIEAYNALT